MIVLWKKSRNESYVWVSDASSNLLLLFAMMMGNGDEEKDHNCMTRFQVLFSLTCIKLLAFVSVAVHIYTYITFTRHENYSVF